MVAGLKFLSKKGFNPQNLTNQKKVWEREQQKKSDETKAIERERQLKRERDDEELAKARGDTLRLRFMYENPPGLETAKKSGEESDAKESALQATRNEGVASLTQRQPGDDDAAAAFRRLLAQSVTSSDVNLTQSAALEAGSAAYSARGEVDKLVMQGTSFDPMTEERSNKSTVLSALEKAVGRKHDSKSLSLEEQIQRFPALANAPRAPGMGHANSSTISQGVTFKPLGTQIRNVRCLACGIWGHSRGDRECEKSGWNPFAAPSEVTAVNAETKNRLGSQDAPLRNEESMQRHESESRGHDRKRRKESQRKKRRKMEPESSSDSSSESSYERDRRRRRRRKEEKRHRRRERSETKHEEEG